ncbi:MAG: 3'(2'),5'-bisphosphate nucleotidase CysQ [Pasteurellaceae bacterium]|nr:3'(2'),5'-bisphosphate nucleotidase CysQ [Pasteurellaceae bacterium]
MPSPLMQSVLAIAQQAGEYLIDFYAKSVQVQIKSDNTPVTEADLFLSQFLTEQLQRLIPNTPVLSEENCNIPLSTRQQWQRYWLIDPLDGTQQFLNRTDQFSIIIALVENHIPILGVIYAPILQTCYYAQQGKGAFKQTPQNRQRLAQRQLDLTLPIRCVVGATSHRKKIQAFFSPRFSYAFQVYGSSGLKSAMVAEGTADCYIRLGNTGEWDTAASEILLAETNSYIVDTQFRPLTYNQRESLVNPHFAMCADKQQNWDKIFTFNSQ